jgi:hypothetical protein
LVINQSLRMIGSVCSTPFHQTRSATTSDPLDFLLCAAFSI